MQAPTALSSFEQSASIVKFRQEKSRAALIMQRLHVQGSYKATENRKSFVLDEPKPQLKSSACVKGSCTETRMGCNTESLHGPGMYMKKIFRVERILDCFALIFKVASYHSPFEQYPQPHS